ncbi:hypothetical protein [Erythrobacter sp. HL-111]|uniref:hypothetical protein n=1 Tax=Erythrobacter sp. HL-111 TaxID=1798193 RepID=UPI0006D98C37|nr:hypothetical protein [Erythrobacter sp. HL-111]KPP90467.1 MAG: hypothetical protein HLUCCO15_09380 [Erythrobacteraceae bacterium HL-111]SDT12807.1 hypothetical protein SAMN04515621_2974 [Erythrobacter sp. HL-111]
MRASTLLLGGLAALLVVGLALLLPRFLLPGDAPAASPQPPAAPAAGVGPRPELGLHTGLPLHRPLDLGIEALARGEGEVPWQRRAIERGYRIVPLDTLAPVPGLTGEDPASDPLAALTRLAVIQPRGLSPADNVALDDWVRAGGRLLLVLDPMLTGDYDLPLGDPRRPNAVALIPPVVERWGMKVMFDETQAAAPRFAEFAGGTLPLALAGRVQQREGAGADCTFAADRALARCRVGEGSVTLLADATLFEHAGLAAEAGQGGSAILALFDHAFACDPAGDFTGKPARCAGKGGE